MSFMLATVLPSLVVPLAYARAPDATYSPWQSRWTGGFEDEDKDVMLAGYHSAASNPMPRLPDLYTTAIEFAADRSMAGQAGDAGFPNGQRKARYKANASTILVAVVLLGLLVAATLPIMHSQGVLPFLSVISYIGCLCMVKICVKELFTIGFKYPYAVTSLHMLFTAIVASIIDHPRPAEGKSTFTLSLMKAVSLGLNNLALVFGSAALVSIVGACTPATTYLVELGRHRSPTFARTFGVMTVCGGAVLCVKGELSFSTLSAILAVGAAISRSLKTVWSHDLLAINMSAYRLAAWTSIWSFVIMSLPTLTLEGLAPWQQLYNLSLYGKLVLAASCFVATWLNIVMCFCLKYLGPVQQNVFGTLELLSVIVLATVLLHEVVTGIEWAGVALIISGCLLIRLDDHHLECLRAWAFNPTCHGETTKLIP